MTDEMRARIIAYNKAVRGKDDIIAELSARLNQLAALIPDGLLALFPDELRSYIERIKQEADT